MKKGIIVLVAAVVISNQVLAETANVNVYGNIDVSYDSIQTGNATNGTAGITSGQVASNISYLGFKGNSDLGSGASAIWQIESSINIGDTGATQNSNFELGNRDTFAGLKSDSLGVLLAGRYGTPYKLSARRLDQFAGGIADNRSLLGVAGYSTFDGRQDQSMVYISPNLNDVTIMAAYANLAPSVSTGLATSATIPVSSTVPLTANAKANVSSVAVWYDANGFYGSVAHETHNNLGINSIGMVQSESATRLSLGYSKDGFFSIGAIAEKTSDNLASSAATGGIGGDLDGHTTYYLSGRYYYNERNIIKAAYTNLGGLTNGNPNSGSTQIALGFERILNKRTTVYILYTQLHNDSAASYSLSSASISSIGGASTISGAGASPSAMALGVKIIF